ncbi:cAMP-regulated phosphoprotein 19 [Toxorhynchites rutilus septentrionalis]|uniref:cAMP-regulated phosphoprotein 19 n=1 Tax=Toxorhynchites rutilus septentrionalis TaxID=329112 RepID=UPI00247B15C0|nr:cAMP-regulated phosphoprotein 19 [Toxorhynchites rutilus septentrionalis]XP_055627365.1 cAMP-regulated phosphoprotein 19 [Toxorhynchites rutilus septentrionalis]
MSTEESADQSSVEQTTAEQAEEQEQSVGELEKQEEAKLKAKYGGNSGLGGPRGLGGHSAFLQKRLQKGQKYFDSGDYQMAKQKGGGVKQVFANKVPTGEAIPTPESVPVRKTSIIQTCNKFQNS